MVLYPKEVNLTIVNGEEWLWNPAKFFVVCFYWELKQTMGAQANHGGSGNEHVTKQKV